MGLPLVKCHAVAGICVYDKLVVRQNADWLLGRADYLILVPTDAHGPDRLRTSRMMRRDQRPEAVA